MQLGLIEDPHPENQNDARDAASYVARDVRFVQLQDSWLKEKIALAFGAGDPGSYRSWSTETEIWDKS